MAHLLVERNAPFDVEFAGWRSDSYTLSRCGWRIAIEQNPRGFAEHELTFIFHHDESGLSMIGTAPSNEFALRNNLPQFHQDFDRHFVRIQRVAQKWRSTVLFRMGSSNLNSFAWVDGAPKFMEVNEVDLYRLPLFMELGKPAAEELIVEPDQVGRILEMIHKAQAPEQAAIRERNRLRNRREEREVPRLHAHILSLAA